MTLQAHSIMGFPFLEVDSVASKILNSFHPSGMTGNAWFGSTPVESCLNIGLHPLDFLLESVDKLLSLVLLKVRVFVGIVLLQEGIDLPRLHVDHSKQMENLVDLLLGRHDDWNRLFL